MSALADKIRRARETKVEAGGREFTIRRPTDAEAMEFGQDGGIKPLDLVCRFTVGWNLTELDLIPGGVGVAVEFDAEAFREWAADQPETLSALSTAVVQAYTAHAAKRGDAEKN